MEEKTDWMKYILIGLGALLVFQWLRGQYRMTSELVVGGQPQQPQQQQPQQQAAPGGAASGAAPESTGVPPSDGVLEQAALYPEKAHLAGGWRTSWHGWNYYRAQAAIKAGLCSPPCSEYAPVLGERVGLTDNQGITAAEYHGYLAQIGAQTGISGLMWTRSMQPGAWRM